MKVIIGKFFVATMFLAASVAASAGCFGSDNFKTCTDDNGNTYNVQRYGNTTSIQGSNPGTGSQWNQTSTTI